jgi:hypothetical protein
MRQGEKMKRFVLVAITRGDSLIASERVLVAESADRQTLEVLQAERKKEREDFLSKDSLPWWAECSLIDRDEIEEVETV